jgi:peroxiredoxin
MANNLTGDYEAVIQISVRQINGLLATMHQNAIDPEASPTFPHSVRIRVGDRPLYLDPGVSRFRTWLGTAVDALRDSGGVPADLRSFLVANAPPAVSAVFDDSFNHLVEAEAETVTGATAPGTERGWADVQLSTPTVSLPPGSTSEVTVHVDVRGYHTPDPGAAALPEPIHGEVQATYTVEPKTVGGRRVLRVRVSSDDNQILFLPKPGTGLIAADSARISKQVRNALRTQFVAEDVNLDDDFPFLEFKGLASAFGQAVALPLQLSNAPLPPGAIGSVTNHFLGSGGFAIALSKEYIQTFFDSVIASIKASAATISIPVNFFLLSTVYRASVRSISRPTWRAGEIEISGTIDLVTRSVAPNGFISFTQILTVELDVPTQSVALKPKGDPAVNESWFIPHSRAVDEVKKARDQALPGAGAPLNNAFNDAKAKLLRGLSSFDNAASVTYQALEVTPDGIILRGAIGTRRRRMDPVVHYWDTPDGNALTAWESWIPAGRIDEYHWSWQRGTFDVDSKTEEHRFVFRKPAPPNALTAASASLFAGIGSICLRITGSQTLPDGSEQSIDAGTSCQPVWSEPILTWPPDWLETHIPTWLPRWPEGEPLEEVIAGHINVAAQSRVPGALTANTLIHVAGSGAERPLEALGQALAQMTRQDMSLVVILVLPTGSFASRRNRGDHRRELDEMLGSLGERFTGQLHITEDYREGWTKLFAAGDGPSTYLLNARGEYVWKQEGKLDTRELAAGLDENLLPASAPRTVLLRLAVQPGERAPDALFQDDQGERTALRRLRGRRVLLNFWKSWSTPSIRELRRLQHLQQHGDATAPVILAVNGGEECSVLTEVRCQHNLTFPLIHDPEQSIASLYGVQCWPTTVFINQEGIVSRIQFGIAHEPGEESP